MSRQILINREGITELSSTSEAHEQGLAAAFLKSLADEGTVVFVAEELLFWTSFSLPAKTPNIAAAIGFQLDMLVPFAEGSFYSAYETSRQGNSIEIQLCAVEHKYLEPHLAAIREAGEKVSGLYPLSQRFAKSGGRKEEWALYLAEPMPKVFLFGEGKMLQRICCHTPPSAEELAELCNHDRIFTPEPPENETAFQKAKAADQLGSGQYNILPKEFRRPDYLKYAILGLVALNLVALLCLGGLKVYHLASIDSAIEAELGKLKPEIKQVRSINAREEKLQRSIDRLEKLGENPDVLGLLVGLTKRLPNHSYLDQIRMDKRDGAIFLHGYTDNIGDLTSALSALGEVQLKTTSRRNNMTYFQVEIGLK